jgi:hypothetical protein
MEQLESGAMLNRKIPGMMLAAVLAVMGMHHWYVLTEHRGFMLAMFLLPPFGMLAVGGIIHPPILYSIGKYGKAMPVQTRAIGYLLAVSGLAVGLYLFKFVYQF